MVLSIKPAPPRTYARCRRIGFALQSSTTKQVTAFRTRRVIPRVGGPTPIAWCFERLPAERQEDRPGLARSEMAEDEDRDAILLRRTRLIAAALAGMLVPSCAP